MINTKIKDSILDSEKKRNVQICIADTGMGIEKKYLDRIFDPFFTSKIGEGTGLGLSIAYSIIKDHNGDIDIKSNVSQGVIVTISLPELDIKS